MTVFKPVCFYVGGSGLTDTSQPSIVVTHVCKIANTGQ